MAQSRGAQKGSTSDLVMQGGQQFGPGVNKVSAHPRSSHYKGHASTCLHDHVPHPEVTEPILQLSTLDCDRVEWPSQPDSRCFTTLGFQSLCDEAPCLTCFQPTHLLFQHILFFIFVKPNTFLFCPSTPPQEMDSDLPPCLCPVFPSLPCFVLHISLLIVPISSHTFSTILRTSSIVRKLTFRHYHLNLSLCLIAITSHDH